MSSEQPVSPTTEPGLAIILPPHLTENFEKAESQLEAAYGVAPGVEKLIRLWLACGTSSQIRREFESAVLDIRNRAIEPDAAGNFDDDYL